MLYVLDVRHGALLTVDTESGETTTVTDGLTTPDGIVVDTRNRVAQISLMGKPDRRPAPGDEPPFTGRDGAVVRVDLESGEVTETVPTGTFTTGKQLTVDRTTGRLYWADREGHGIYRCESDGSGVARLVDTAGTGPSEIEEQCVGVAVDPARGHVYWTQKGPAKGGRGRILRARLALPDGSGADSRPDIEVLWRGLPEPIDLEISEGYLYWTDRGREPLGNTLNRAPLPVDGAEPTAPTVLAGGFREAIGLAIDEAKSMVYVSDLSGTIREIGVGAKTGHDRTVVKLRVSATGIALG